MNQRIFTLIDKDCIAWLVKIIFDTEINTIVLLQNSNTLSNFNLALLQM